MSNYSNPTFLRNSALIQDESYREFNWIVPLNGTVPYESIINYERAGKKGNRHCVMCGLKEGTECMIPNQNKDVCRICDSTYWFVMKRNVLVKFCKGCKTFFPLMNFDEKPEASKCGTCRRRGRDNYHFKKEKGVDVRSQTMKKIRTNALSPQEFCTLVNTMNEDDGESIDMETVLEYASYELKENNGGSEIKYFQESSSPPTQPTFIINNVGYDRPPLYVFANDNSSSMIFDDLYVDDDDYDEDERRNYDSHCCSNVVDDLYVDDDDQEEDEEEMKEMFIWLPELVISPPLSPDIYR